MSAHYLHYILTGAATFMFPNAAEVKPCQANFLDVAGVEAHAKAVASNLHQSENLNEASYF